MKIAIVEPDSARNNTAFQAQVKTWEFLARERNIESTVFANRSVDYRNTVLDVLKLRRIGGRFWFPPYPALLHRLRGYSVVATDDPSLYPHAIWAALASRASRSRLVINTSVTLLTPSADNWQGALILRMARSIFRQAHRVVVPSPLTTRRLVALGLLPAGSPKLVELGHPIDTDIFHPREGGADEGTINILSVGKLIFEKGHHIVIEALAEVLRESPTVRLTFAGEGEYRQTLEELCAKLGVSDKVSFVGFIPNDQLGDLYRDSQILVHHPFTTELWEEYFGVAVVEAMSSGLPVVVSDCGALPYIVPDDVGFHVAQRDGRALRERVQQLIDTPALRADMGAKGREFVLRRYAIPEIARRWSESVLGQPIE